MPQHNIDIQACKILTSSLQEVEHVCRKAGLVREERHVVEHVGCHAAQSTGYYNLKRDVPFAIRKLKMPTIKALLNCSDRRRIIAFNT